MDSDVANRSFVWHDSDDIFNVTGIMVDERDTNETNEVEAASEPGELPMFQTSDPAPREIMLEIVQQKQKDRVKLVFDNQPLIIGRGDDDNPIEIDVTPYDAFESGVSRQHAALLWEDDGLFVVDLGSKNGTRINGFNLEAHRPYRLRNGDEIELGRLRTIVRFVH